MILELVYLSKVVRFVESLTLIIIIRRYL